MSTSQRRDVLLRTITDGPATLPKSIRMMAYQNSFCSGKIGEFVHAVHELASTISDEQVYQLKQVGLTDDEIFELVVCGAVGAADVRLEAAINAINGATHEA